MPARARKPCANQLCGALVEIGTIYCEACARTRPRAPCREPGCPALVEFGERYCPEHKRRRENQRVLIRGTAHSRGYGVNWRKVRAIKLGRTPLCEMCEKQNRLRQASQVHHIDHDSRNNADENLMSVCVPCHVELGRTGR